MTNTNSGQATSTEVICQLCFGKIQQQEPWLSQEPEGKHGYVHRCCYIASELERMRAEIESKKEYIASELERMRAEIEAEAKYDAFDTIIRNALRRQEARRAQSLQRK
jgi:hypothetical protein